jgi:hypothetical protein
MDLRHTVFLPAPRTNLGTDTWPFKAFETISSTACFLDGEIKVQGIGDISEDRNICEV